MRGRRPGLLVLEVAVLEFAQMRDASPEPEFHGFSAAQSLTEAGFQPRLAATGTIYTTLDRLRKAGFLESRWEDAALSEREGRPRRKLYRITGAGKLALAEAQRHDVVPRPSTGLAGTAG